MIQESSAPLSRSHHVKEGTLRMAPLLPMPALLASIGYAPAPLIAEAGLAQALFDDAENTVSLNDAGRFIALCADRTGCPHLGLLLGAANVGIDVLGIVGKLAGCSPDIGVALRNITLYMHLHDRIAMPAIHASNELATFAYVIYHHEVLGIELIYDTAIVIACNILKDLAGPEWVPEVVCLSRPRPADIAPYRRFFGAHISFGAETNAVVFKARWLDHPLGSADASAQDCLIREMKRLEALGSGSLAEQLRRILRRLFISGGDPRRSSLESISSLFAVHRRTLNRRLRDEGTTFKALMDAARHDIACQLLRDTQLTTLDVAMTLGYADAAAFSRAFRRWSGTSPAAWRSTIRMA